ncbi:hypothetical protein GCM10029978_037750 [Actinoallomurus acanthiterrae]
MARTAARRLRAGRGRVRAERSPAPAAGGYGRDGPRDPPAATKVFPSFNEEEECAEAYAFRL